MSYDDRDVNRNRRDDGDQPPRRPSQRSDREEPRPNRSSRPLNDQGSNTPSRPRSGQTPDRGVPSQRRGDTPRSAGGDQVGQRARDAVRRVRDGMSNMYDAVSREVQSVNDRRSAGRKDSSSRRDDGRRSPSYERANDTDWDDDSRSSGSRGDDDSARTPVAARGRGTSGSKDNKVAAIIPEKPQQSLVMRLRARRKKVRSNKSNAILLAFLSSIGAVFLAAIIGAGGFLGYYSSSVYQRYYTSLVRISTTSDGLASRIYDRHGVLLFEAYNRTQGQFNYLAYCQIPKVVIDATVDTEDATFWDNIGVDPNGLLRAALGGGSVGGSTITQQVIKLKVLHDNRHDISRKIDEAILAIDANQRYTKKDIITDYLDYISYNHNSNGIEEAAINYFHLQPKTINVQDSTTWNAADKEFVQHAKDEKCITDTQKTVQESAAWQLQPWQAMLLAGVPQAPATQDPYSNPTKALARLRDGVLRNVALHNPEDLMLDGKKATTAQILAKATEQLTPPNGADKTIFAAADVQSTSARKLAPFFVDYVINQMTALYGDYDTFASAGLNIYTTLDYGDPNITDAQLDSLDIDLKTGALISNDGSLKPDDIKRVGLQQYAEYIARRNIQGGVKGGYPDYWYCPITTGGTVLKYTGTPATNPFGLGGNVCLRQGLNIPLAQNGKNVNDAAIVAIDPRNGDILAQVGGVDYNSLSKPSAGGQNDVTISKQRSLGSAFKPIVYATAFEMGMTPASFVQDQPICFPGAPQVAANVSPTDNYMCGVNYLAHDYSNNDWGGPMPITLALGNSLNPPAELALSFTGLRADTTAPLLSMANRLGITTLKSSELGYATALGAQGVPLQQLTSAYGTFANGGIHVPPRSILTIKTQAGEPVYTLSGQQLFPYNPNPQGGRAVSPQTAYQITSILATNEDRPEFGPDNPLHFWGRDVAAKTGTSQNIQDIVTMGYTPWLALGVWAGNVDNDKIDPSILGIAGAGYIFNALMNFAINQYNMPGTLPSKNAPLVPGGYFPVPPGLHYATLNCTTGLAPYAGEDLSKPCPTAPVPLYMTPEFSNGGTNLSPLAPNKPWIPYGWTIDKNGINMVHNNAWLVDGLDPLVP